MKHFVPSSFWSVNSLSTLGPPSPLFPIPLGGAKKQRPPQDYSNSGSRNETHSYFASFVRHVPFRARSPAALLCWSPSCPHRSLSGRCGISCESQGNRASATSCHLPKTPGQWLWDLRPHQLRLPTTLHSVLSGPMWGWGWSCPLCFCTKLFETVVNVNKKVARLPPEIPVTLPHICQLLPCETLSCEQSQGLFQPL